MTFLRRKKMRQENEKMDIDVKVTLTIKGKEVDLTLDELK